MDLTKLQLSKTKKKILQVAYELFAENSYEGTSIRDISKKAQVNVAAVNYHFQNKANLYRAIVSYCYVETSEKIRAYSHKESPTPEKLALKIFDFYLEDPNFLVTTFRLFLSKDFPFPENFGVEDDSYGPPGGHSFFLCLTKEVGEQVSEEKRMWAQHVIFSHLLQCALVLASPNSQKKTHLPHAIDRSMNEEGIVTLVKMIIGNLKVT